LTAASWLLLGILLLLLLLQLVDLFFLLLCLRHGDLVIWWNVVLRLR
jgi:hypothetical protein